MSALSEKLHQFCSWEREHHHLPLPPPPPLARTPMLVLTFAVGNFGIIHHEHNVFYRADVKRLQPTIIITSVIT